MLDIFVDNPSGREYSENQTQAYKSNYQREQPIIKRCQVCGFRIRGENHANGEHHNKVSQSRMRRR